MTMQRVAPAEIVVLRGMGLLCCKGVLLSHGRLRPCRPAADSFPNRLLRAAASCGVWMPRLPSPLRPEYDACWMVMCTAGGDSARKHKVEHCCLRRTPHRRLLVCQRQARRWLRARNTARRRLAALMALHARLGAGASLQTLGADVLRTCLLLLP